MVEGGEIVIRIYCVRKKNQIKGNKIKEWIKKDILVFQVEPSL